VDFNNLTPAASSSLGFDSLCRVTPRSMVMSVTKKVIQLPSINQIQSEVHSGHPKDVDTKALAKNASGYKVS